MRLFATTILLLLTGVAAAPANTSHEGWPTRDGVLKIAPNTNTTYTGTSRNDELLGGDGSDTLSGAAGDDVLWGDKNPSGQPTTQHDTLNGGPGNDFIYASHGTNTIDAGPGNDTIHAHPGKGSIDCGAGKDVLFISHKSEPHYKIRHCETVSFATVGH